MADISVTIHRPVAVPTKFLGAPQTPAAISMTTFVTGMMIMFADKDLALIGVFILLPCMIVSHIYLIYRGYQEPHMSSLIATYYLTKIRPKVLGRRFTNIFRAE